MGTLSKRTLLLAGTRAWFYAKNRHSKPTFLRIFFGICFLLLSVLLIRYQFQQSSSLSFNSKPSSQFGFLGVPWCRSNEGLSIPWTREDLLNGLREFVPVYEKRPIKNNVHGMGFDHSFGLWFIVRQLKPGLLVESGALKGHSTWVMRQALRNIPIITISPRHPEKYLKEGPAYVDGNTRYFSGKQFVDFGNIQWDKVLEEAGVEDRSKVLVFFDDHQSQLKRLKQAKNVGFKHLIFEDNYDTGTGDHYSLRQICDQVETEGGGHSCDKNSEEAQIREARKGTWEKSRDVSQLCGDGGEWWGFRGEMRDNSNHSITPITYQQHVENGHLVESLIKIYWELPPVAAPSLTKQKRYDPARSSVPIIRDGEKDLFKKIGLSRFEKLVFNGYTQMAYVELIDNMA